MQRPARTECADYYFTYIDQVPSEDALAVLDEQLRSTPEFLGAIPASKLDFRYAAGKWTIKEVVGHVIDVERAFAHRAFCFARREPTPLPSFEQEHYVQNSRYRERRWDEIIAEYECVRRATLALFRSFGDEEWLRRGRASGYDFTVRTIPFIVAGHEIHHRKGLDRNYLEA
jgi:uncharacterized damage-inducible protein DinB